MDYPVCLCGDCAVTLQIGNEISEQVNREVVNALAAIRRADISGVCELVPTYTSICIHYDPAVLSYEALRNALKLVKADPVEEKSDQGERVVESPVC